MATFTLRRNSKKISLEQYLREMTHHCLLALQSKFDPLQAGENVQSTLPMSLCVLTLNLHDDSLLGRILGTRNPYLNPQDNLRHRRRSHLNSRHNLSDQLPLHLSNQVTKCPQQ